MNTQTHFSLGATPKERLKNCLEILMRGLCSLLVCFGLSGCFATRAAKTAGERASGYSYIPLDPFAVNVPATFFTNCTSSTNFVESKMLLKALPDNAVRISIARFTASGDIAYGPAGITSAGETYRLTLDYINADTTTFPVYIRKSAFRRIGGSILTNKTTMPSIVLDDGVTNKVYWVPVKLLWSFPGTRTVRPYIREHVPLGQALSDEYLNDKVTYEVKWRSTNDVLIEKGFEPYNIPIYVGVGLRLIADVTALKNNVSISGLSSIDTDSMRGTLTVQTLGINGKSIAAALPIGNELNPTTVGNALVAIGSIKALLHEEGVSISPRIVGMYLPTAGDNALVNAIISSLAENGVNWNPRSRGDSQPVKPIDSKPKQNE